jgi:uncharacterized phiE125 gp8 family phage protein
MSGLVVHTAPSAEPTSDAETIAYLRTDSGVDTTLIQNLVISAREWVEFYLNRTLLNTTYQLYLDTVPEIDAPIREGIYVAPYKVYLNNYIELPKAPVSSVTHVKYYDDADSASTWATSNYYSDLISEPARIVLKDGGSFPTDLRNANGIEVQYVAGYGSSRSDIPEPIRMAVLQYVAHLYEHRGDTEAKTVEPPAMIKSLLQPYKIDRFGVSSFGRHY